MKKMKIAVGSDHAGYFFKSQLVRDLKKAGHSVVDCGAPSDESSDYPDYALRVGKAVASGECERGILACGSGIGMCIAANKVNGIRAALVWSVEVAKLSVQHNWSNVLCLPARFVAPAHLKKIVKAWLETPIEAGGRHERRVKKILKIEAKSIR